MATHCDLQVPVKEHIDYATDWFNTCPPNTKSWRQLTKDIIDGPSAYELALALVDTCLQFTGSGGRRIVIITIGDGYSNHDPERSTWERKGKMFVIINKVEVLNSNGEVRFQGGMFNFVDNIPALSLANLGNNTSAIEIQAEYSTRTRRGTIKALNDGELVYWHTGMTKPVRG